MGRYRELVAGLERVAGRVPVLPGYGATGIVVGARHRAVFPLLRDELEALTGGRCEVVTGDLDADRVAALLVYPLRDAPAVQTLIGGRNLEEIALPDELAGAPLSEFEPRLADRDEAPCREIRAAGEALLPWPPGRRRSSPPWRRGGRSAGRLEVLAGAGVSDHLVCSADWAPRTGGTAGRALTREVAASVLVVQRRGRPALRRRASPSRKAGSCAPSSRSPRSSPCPLRDARPDPADRPHVPGVVGLMMATPLRPGSWSACWPSPAGGETTRIRRSGDRPRAGSRRSPRILFGRVFGDLGSRCWDPRSGSRARRGSSRSWRWRRHRRRQVGLGLVLGAVNAVRLRDHRAAAGSLAMAVVLGTALVGLGAIAGVVPEGIGAAALVGLGGAGILAALSLGVAGPIEAMGLVGRVLSYARLTAIGLAR